MGPIEPAQRLAAFHHQVQPLLLHMVGGGIVDERAHERLRIGEWLIDDQPVDQLPDGHDQRLFLAVFDDQPPRRGAALAS